MTLIQSLLTELGGAAFAHHAAEAGRAGQAVLTLADTVVLRLDMSSDEDHLLLSSEPGRLPSSIDTDPGQPGLMAWEAIDPECPDAIDRLLIDPLTRQIVLQRCVARQALDPMRFRRELERCVERHEHWRASASVEGARPLAEQAQPRCS